MHRAASSELAKSIWTAVSHGGTIFLVQADRCVSAGWLEVLLDVDASANSRRNLLKPGSRMLCFLLRTWVRGSLMWLLSQTSLAVHMHSFPRLSGHSVCVYFNHRPAEDLGNTNGLMLKDIFWHSEHVWKKNFWDFFLFNAWRNPLRRCVGKEAVRLAVHVSFEHQGPM